MNQITKNENKKQMFLQKLYLKWKQWIEQDRKKAIIIISSLSGILIVGFIFGIIVVASSDKEVTVYRETQAILGDLVVGVEESGTSTVGTVSQTFDLDLSAFSSSSDTTFSWDNMMGNMQSVMSGTSSTTSSDRLLEIEEVYLAVGQEVKKGDPVLKLTKDSVDTLRNELLSDETSAEISLSQVATDNQQALLTANNEYNTNISFGGYAQQEYNVTVNELTKAVTDATETLADNQEELADLQEDLATYQSDLVTQQELLKNAEYAADGTDKTTALYWWVIAENARDDTVAMIDTLETEIEDTQTSIKTAEAAVVTAQNDLTTAQKALETGTVEAQAKYDSRMLNFNYAQELLDVSTALTNLDLKIAQEDYDDAKKKLDEFDSYITDQTVYSDYNGVITAFDLVTGGYLDTDTTILTVNNYDDVSITVTVDEEDIDSIALGNKANITFTAFPDEVFEGEVSEIGDATLNSATSTTTYEVTVSLSGDTSILLDGMTADVTFITKETKQVLYVSNRAIIRDGDQSYVKVKNESGKIVEKEVTTGFSDGVNVEIKEGLSAGDSVLIESKVSD